MYITPQGEDTLLICKKCQYAANRQIALHLKKAFPKDELLDVEKIETPDVKTIVDLAEYLDIPEYQTAKAVFMIASIPEGNKTIEKFIFAITRGDMALNETKLTNAIKASELRPATEEEIESIGAVPGYASPIGLPTQNNYLPVVIVVDELIPESTNLVAGANETGYHLKNTNYGRDYHADIITDITAAQDGDGCPQCGFPLHMSRGVEVGNIFQLGTRYSEAMGATFQDIDGSEKPVIMGSYGIGSGRLLACVAEEYHDDWGLIWPITVAPYHIHLVMLPHKNDAGATEETANKLYEDLQTNGLEVLFDDRNESPGVKFNDADLIGLPIRVTVSSRGVSEGIIEIKRRDQDKSQKRMIAIDEAIAIIQVEKAKLEADIKTKIVVVPYKD